MLLAAGLGLGAVPLLAGDASAQRPSTPVSPATPSSSLDAAALGVLPDIEIDQSKAIQAAIDTAARQAAALQFAPGRYRAAGLRLGASSVLRGAGGQTTLVLAGEGPMLSAQNATAVAIESMVIDGGHLAINGAARGVVALDTCSGVTLAHLLVRHSSANGLMLSRCAGRITCCTLRHAAEAAIFAIDSNGLAIVDNDVAHCGNNGIQVWRSSPGEDGTIVARNRITHIAARGGGSGQNGNGVNAFRAGNVVVDGNRISDCAYSAVRANAASNVQIIANNCSRIGEVAIYAEFGFEGAVISGNLIDAAAAGISVTNFNVGGRLAVVQGNIVRNLKRREHEPVDKRGEGIAVEADAVVSGNVVDGAPTAGLMLGWGPYLRNVAATGNVIRDCGVGILVSADPSAGACLVTGNLISGARNGAIRGMDGNGVPIGDDLARSATLTERVSISGNLAV